MERCIFCEIAAGRAPASIAYEDEDVLAFMDLNPALHGHLLVMPKAHVCNLFDCPPELAAKTMAVATRLVGPLRAATGCEGMNVWVANEAVAGQTVRHLHLHLLPRRAGDGFGFRLPSGYPRRATRAELDEIAAAIRRHIVEGE